MSFLDPVHFRRADDLVFGNHGRDRRVETTIFKSNFWGIHFEIRRVYENNCRVEMVVGYLYRLWSRIAHLSASFVFLSFQKEFFEKNVWNGNRIRVYRIRKRLLSGRKGRIADVGEISEQVWICRLIRESFLFFSIKNKNCIHKSVCQFNTNNSFKTY